MYGKLVCRDFNRHHFTICKPNVTQLTSFFYLMKNCCQCSESRRFPGFPAVSTAVVEDAF